MALFWRSVSFLFVIHCEEFRLSPELRAGIVSEVASLVQLLNSTNVDVRSECVNQREELMDQLRSLAIYLWMDQGIADIREL
jgi:hypothetical protein